MTPAALSTSIVYKPLELVPQEIGNEGIKFYPNDKKPSDSSYSFKEKAIRMLQKEEFCDAVLGTIGPLASVTLIAYVAIQIFPAETTAKILGAGFGGSAFLLAVDRMIRII